MVNEINSTSHCTALSTLAFQRQYQSHVPHNLVTDQSKFQNFTNSPFTFGTSVPSLSSRVVFTSTVPFGNTSPSQSSVQLSGL